MFLLGVWWRGSTFSGKTRVYYSVLLGGNIIGLMLINQREGGEESSAGTSSLSLHLSAFFFIGAVAGDNLSLSLSALNVPHPLISLAK